MELVERQLGMITGARSRRRASVASVLAVSPSAHKLEGNAAFSSLIESFLAAVKVIGDRTPTDREIEVGAENALCAGKRLCLSLSPSARAPSR